VNPESRHSALITTDKALAQAIEEMRTCAVIAVDTEFIREKTYYAQLCLIQIAFGDQVVLIDPLADLDLAPLGQIMSDAAILKVFHSGRQDLEILYHLFGDPVAPIFDTQSAASLMGMPDQVAYATFIKQMLDVELEKVGSFSQWARRPLSAQQIAYAQEDVTYLLAAYPIALERLAERGRESWLDDEFAYRATKDYVADTVPEQAYRFVKRVSSLSPRQAAVAREVAAWRQIEAMRADLPRRRILPDESLIEISRKQPTSPASLHSVRGLGQHAMTHTQQILAAVRAGKRVSAEELPQLKSPEKPTALIEPTVKLATALVAARAKEYQIAPNVLASSAMLEEFARTPDSSAQLMQGWRKMMIGDELSDLIKGKIALFLYDGKVQTVSLDAKGQALLNREKWRNAPSQEKE